MIIFICSVHGNFDSTNGIPLMHVVSSGHETTSDGNIYSSNKEMVRIL